MIIIVWRNTEYVNFPLCITEVGNKPILRTEERIVVNYLNESLEYLLNQVGMNRLWPVDVYKNINYMELKI